MHRTFRFIVIVASVSAATSFLLSALDAGAVSHAGDPAFIGTVFGMVAGFAFLLTTGRKVRIADPEARRAALAQSPPTAGMARILVVRQVRVGTLIGADVVVDGLVMAHLTSPRFTMLTCAAGPHRVSAVAQGRPTRPVLLDLTEGETAILRISAGWGGAKLSREPDSAGLRASLAAVPMVEPLEPMPT